VNQRIEGLREELHDLADEVRAMAPRAHPAILDHLGLPNALQSLASDMAVSDDLRVAIEDQGAGMAEQGSAARGLGLRGLSERLRAVQGNVSVTSHPSRGTTLAAWVPRQ
jgi:signal transduction histidine kinase